ncbi:MAG: pyridoxal-phosphate dependent enzyme [Pirellulaceae bacterium]
MLSLENIAKASRVVDPVFLNSPQYVSDGLSERLGMRLLVKIECLNPIRSFKGRGTDFFLHQLGDCDGPLVTASAGNFGQGLAYAARRRGIEVIVYAAETANPKKVARMQQLGATTRLAGDDFDAAKEIARSFAASSGLRFVEDGREPAIAEGAGTIGVELLARGEPIDVLLIPVGNGALISGVGAWVKAHRPSTRIIGVVAETAPSMLLSWRAGEVVTTATAATIADGVAVRLPVPQVLPLMRDVVDDMLAVPEAAIHLAMQRIQDEVGVVAEGAGALALAAAEQLKDTLRGQCVVAPICGSNVF